MFSSLSHKCEFLCKTVDSHRHGSLEMPHSNSKQYPCRDELPLTSHILHIMQAQSPFALVGDSFVLRLGGVGQQRYMPTGQQDHPILAAPQYFNDSVILFAGHREKRNEKKTEERSRTQATARVRAKDWPAISPDMEQNSRLWMILALAGQIRDKCSIPSCWETFLATLSAMQP